MRKSDKSFNVGDVVCWYNEVDFQGSPEWVGIIGEISKGKIITKVCCQPWEEVRPKCYFDLNPQVGNPIFVPTGEGKTIRCDTPILISTNDYVQDEFGAVQIKHQVPASMSDIVEPHKSTRSAFYATLEMYGYDNFGNRI